MMKFRVRLSQRIRYQLLLNKQSVKIRNRMPLKNKFRRQRATYRKRMLLEKRRRMKETSKSTKKKSKNLLLRSMTKKMISKLSTVMQQKFQEWLSTKIKKRVTT